MLDTSISLDVVVNVGWYTGTAQMTDSDFLTLPRRNPMRAWNVRWINISPDKEFSALFTNRAACIPVKLFAFPFLLQRMLIDITCHHWVFWAFAVTYPSDSWPDSDRLIQGAVQDNVVIQSLC